VAPPPPLVVGTPWRRLKLKPGSTVLSGAMLNGPVIVCNDDQTADCALKIPTFQELSWTPGTVQRTELVVLVQRLGTGALVVTWPGGGTYTLAPREAVAFTTIGDDAWAACT
jgi:hypothetical protein